MLRFPLAILLSSLLSALAAQERVALPNATGTVMPSSGWTVLRAPELAAAQRASDPTAEPGRTTLLAAIEQVQKNERTGDHVLFHAPGAVPGSLRLVNAYSAPGRATSKDLVSPASAEAIRKVLEPTLTAPDVTVTWLGHADAQLFPIGSLVLRFQLACADRRWELHHHVVPAGTRLQYLETMHFVDDADGPAAIDALLRTFDGAREATGNPILVNMMIGGIAGAVAGIAAGLLRRRWRLRRTAASGPAVG